MNLNKAIRQEVGNNKYPTLGRIKVGKALMVIAAIPAGTSWMAAIAAPMMIPIKPTLWAKDKIRHIKQGVQFLW